MWPFRCSESLIVQPDQYLPAVWSRWYPDWAWLMGWRTREWPPRGWWRGRRALPDNGFKTECLIVLEPQTNVSTMHKFSPWIEDIIILIEIEVCGYRVSETPRVLVGIAAGPCRFWTYLNPHFHPIKILRLIRNNSNTRFACDQD